MDGLGEELKTEELNVHALTYYQKPVIGSNGNTSNSPVQLMFPTGGFSLGIPYKDSILGQQGRSQVDQNFAVIGSGPIHNEIDIHQNRGLKLAFLITAVVNLIVTSLLFFDAASVDTTLVENSSGAIPSVFERVSSERRNAEIVNYCFSVIFMVVGSFSVIFDNSLGISMYCFYVLLNFFFGTASLPYFVYSFRYFLDLGMFYVALVLRTRLVYTFLPLHIYRPHVQANIPV